MIKYILGLFKYFFYARISLFALIDYKSRISKKASINRKSKILKSSVGDYTYVSPNTDLVNAHVGKYCSIAQDCYLGLANHTSSFVSTSPIFTEKTNSTGFSWVKKTCVYDITNKLEIGNDVWIGAKVTILGGLKIGNGAIVGTGAIVTRDIPAYAVVVGVPAKIVKYRFSKEIISYLLKLEWWNIPENILYNNIQLFQSDFIDVTKLKKLRIKE